MSRKNGQFIFYSDKARQTFDGIFKKKCKCGNKCKCKSKEVKDNG